MSRYLPLLALAAAGLTAAQEALPQAPPAARAAPSPDAVLRWNEVALEAIRADKTPPPVAARNLALVHLAAFDAVNAISLSHRPYLVYVTAPAGTAPEAAVAAAAHRVLTAAYPKQADRLDAELADSLRGLSEEGRRGGLSVGRHVADKLLDARRDDGASRRTAYRPAEAPGVWQPTPPKFRAALLPHWGTVTPFAISRPADFDPGPGPALDTAAYTAAFREVKELGAVDSGRRTAEQSIIAWFWEDGTGTVTPPGHWNRVAQTVARQRPNTLEQNARLFALLNVALSDVAVVCWDCKFKYGYWRPVDAVRKADDDGNPDTAADKEWTSLLETPPFPSYTSGHSSFSGAAAAVLAEFFGTDAVRFEVSSEGMPGVTRKFTSFSAAAEEAGRSRIYGGIHYEFDNRRGLEVGRKVGRAVTRAVLRPRE
jgi:hypothetical protein